MTRLDPSPSRPVERAGRVQDALYRIAEAASAAQDLATFYTTIHGIVGELMYARPVPTYAISGLAGVAAT